MLIADNNLILENAKDLGRVYLTNNRIDFTSILLAVWSDSKWQLEIDYLTREQEIKTQVISFEEILEMKNNGLF